MQTSESTLPLHPAMRFLTHPIARKVFRGVMRDRACIFMLHRTEDLATGIHGHTVQFVKEALEALKRSGAKFVPISSMIEAWREGAAVDPDCIAFTMDDGFADQGTMIREAFLPFQCPVTVFLITDFLDGKLWPWDDQLSYALAQARPQRTTISIGAVKQDVDLTTPNARTASLHALRLRCKQIPNDDLYLVLQQIAAALEVTLPLAAPPHYGPMSWQEARSLEAEGVQFGPHSRTHRIFSRLSQEDAALELEGSWARLQQELKAPLPVFAWPTGRACDFSDRDIEIARAAGLLAAVATDSDYAHVRPGEQASALYRLRRFALPKELDVVLRYGSWVGRGRDLLPV